MSGWYLKKEKLMIIIIIMNIWIILILQIQHLVVVILATVCGKIRALQSVV